MDHKIVYQITLIDFWSHLVAFLYFRSHLVAFSAHYLNTPRDCFNHLIDKTFNSHQEYTIATSLLAPARGTTRLCKLLIFRHFTKSCFLCPPNLVTFWSLFSPRLKNRETDKLEFTFTVILNVVKNLFGQPHKFLCYICGVNY